VFLTHSLTKSNNLVNFYIKYSLKGEIGMYRTNEIKLAERIIQLDKLRDELYEELLKKIGTKGHELLRALQNH
jgi:hypothetical protein